MNFQTRAGTIVSVSISSVFVLSIMGKAELESKSEIMPHHLSCQSNSPFLVPVPGARPSPYFSRELNRTVLHFGVLAKTMPEYFTNDEKTSACSRV